MPRLWGLDVLVKPSVPPAALAKGATELLEMGIVDTEEEVKKLSPANGLGPDPVPAWDGVPTLGGPNISEEVNNDPDDAGCDAKELNRPGEFCNRDLDAPCCASSADAPCCEVDDPHKVEEEGPKSEPEIPFCDGPSNLLGELVNPAPVLNKD